MRIKGDYMKKKNVYVILVILSIFLITLSSVSAGEVNATEDLGIGEEIYIDNEDTIDLNTNEGEFISSGTFDNDDFISIDSPIEFEENDISQSDISKENKKNSILSDSDSIIVTDKTFSGIQNSVDNANEGSTIILDGYYLGNGSQITINKQLDFIGINDATLDANYLSGIFYSSVNNVSIKNITFKNGNSTNGGAIYSTTTFSVVNCSFVNNIVSYRTGCGGAIYSTTTFSVVNCSFVNNSATNYFGGAIYFNAVSGSVSGSVVGCSFMNNSATMSGGAVYISGYSFHSASVVGCSFVNNSATNCGGAVYIGGLSNFSSSIVDSSFVNNSANNEGGAIYSNRNCSVVGCSFVNNSANNEGGAMFGNRILASNCSFDSNSAKNGSATYQVTANNCTFTNNNASEYGGAMYGGVAANSNFSHNHANNNGGAVYDVFVAKCLFEYNDATNGGAMSKAKATNCTFNYNYATNFGGAVYDAKVSINSQFNDNVALNGTETDNVDWFEPQNAKSFADLNELINNNSDSDVYLNDHYAFDLTTDTDFKDGVPIGRAVTVHGNGFTISGENTARIFRVTNSSVVFCDIVLVNGKATDYGGAIYSSSNVTVVNCSFENNSAVYRGGAVYVSGSVSVVGCSFVNNSATNYGGAVYVSGSVSVSVVNCSFVNISGGAICYDDSGSGSVVNCSFVNVNGNAIVFYGSGSVVNCSFVNNSATGSGGAVNMDHGSVVNCSFVDNSAGSGGAVYISGSGSVVNCSFVDNSATRSGGAVNMDHGSVVNCSFVNSSASGDGGAIYMDYGSVVNCSFVDNSAGSGGAVYISDRGSVVNCSFVNSSASGFGGAVYISGSVVNCSFVNNSATRSGGAICSGSGSVVNCSFVDNSAGSGGAIYMDYGSVVNCSFVDNSAGDGGSVYISDFDSVVNCSFVNSSASGFGGAIYSYEYWSGSGSVVNCSFVNSSAGSGGIIYSPEYGSGSVVNCSFVNSSVDDGNVIFNMDTVSGCSFVNNSVGNCSVIYNVGTVSGCSFVNVCGIAIYASRGANIFNSSFINDENTNKGSALYINGNGVVSNCTFLNIAADNGGAVYISGSGSVVNCSFVNNSATGSGGAIYMDHGSVVNCSFVDNSASGSGGAIYMDHGSVVNCSFVNNSATNDGGAIYVKNDVEFYNCTCENNTASINSNSKAILISNDMSYYLDDGAILMVNLSDVSGQLPNRVITFNITNLNYNITTNDDGLASLNLSDIFTLSGYYRVQITFEDEDHSSISKNVYVNVMKDRSSLTVNDLFIVFGDDAILKANLSNRNGPLSDRTIIFDIGGSYIYVNTTSSGIATLNMKPYLSSPGEYNIGVIFGGDNFNYNNRTNATVSVKSYFATLSINQIGEYYNGTSLRLSLIDNRTNLGVSDANIELIFSNDNSIILTTDSEGIATYDIPFAPGTYSVYASVIDSNAGVDNVTLNDFEIKYKAGIIEITQNSTKYNNSALFIKLYNFITGDVFKGIKVNLDFVALDISTEVVTNEDGIAIYDIPFAVGTYYLIASVNDAYTNFEHFEKEDVLITGLDSLIIFENDIAFYEFGAGSTNFTVVGGSVDVGNISVVDHPEAIISLNDNIVTISNLSAGNYSLKLITTPDYMYKSSIVYVGINVNKIESNVIFTNGIIFDYGGSGSTNLILDGCTVNQSMISVMDHPEALISLKDNEISVSNLSAGTYSLKVVTIPDSNHNSISEIVNVTVNKVSSAIIFTNLTFEYGSTCTVNLILSGCTVEKENIMLIGADGTDYTDKIRLENNVVFIPDLFIGNYNMVVTTTPDDNHIAVIETARIVVTKIAPNIIFNNNLTFDYGEEGVLNLTVEGVILDESCFSIPGQNANFELEKVVDDYLLHISNLPIGSHTLKVTTHENTIFSSVSKYIVINVLDPNATVIKTNTSVSFGTQSMKFAYGGSGSVTVAVTGGTINLNNIEVIGHKEAVKKYSNGKITISNLTVGTYTLRVTPTPDADHIAKPQNITITVTKISAAITAKAINVYYKNTKKWSIKLMDNSNKKVLANKQIVLKVYTGKKYNTYKVKTNAKGIATFNVPKTLKLGTHKVVLSYSGAYTTCKTLTSKIVVKKRALTINIGYQKFEDGSRTVDIIVKDKATKQAMNKIKVKVLIYTGNKVTKTYAKLLTAYYKYNKEKGYAMYGGGIKAFGKAGTHKIVVAPVDSRYSGKSNAIKISVPKSAKNIKTFVVSNGKMSTLK